VRAREVIEKKRKAYRHKRNAFEGPKMMPGERSGTDWLSEEVLEIVHTGTGRVRVISKPFPRHAPRVERLKYG